MDSRKVIVADKADARTEVVPNKEGDVADRSADAANEREADYSDVSTEEADGEDGQPDLDGVEAQLMAEINEFISNGESAGADRDGGGRTESSKTYEAVANTDREEEGRKEAGETSKEPVGADGGMMKIKVYDNEAEIDWTWIDSACENEEVRTDADVTVELETAVMEGKELDADKMMEAAATKRRKRLR